MTTKKTTTTTTTKTAETKKETTAEKKAPVVSEYKLNVARAEAIGHALTAVEKIDAAAARMKSTKSDHVRELLTAYINGNQKPLPVKELKGIHAETGDDSEAYKAAVLALYASAADYADGMSKHDAAAIKEADTPLFKAWKAYLSLFNEGESKVAPTRVDTAALYAAATKGAREGVEYVRRVSDKGEVSARMFRGVSATTIVPLSTFTKNVERIAAERVMGFDGVVSRAQAREISKANAEKREAAIATISLEKKAG